MTNPVIDRANPPCNAAAPGLTWGDGLAYTGRLLVGTVHIDHAGRYHYAVVMSFRSRRNMKARGDVGSEGAARRAIGRVWRAFLADANLTPREAV